MPRVVPYPPDLFHPERRHLFVFPHQDDEFGHGGVLLRAQRGVPLRAVWVTNGDGLAPLAGEPLDTYAEKRRRESIAAMGELGVAPEALTFLGHSEMDFYAAMADASSADDATHARGVEALWGVLAPAVDGVRRVVREVLPDVVWTLAYQGGHPEHDLTHLCAAHAVRELALETGRRPLFFELPAYELTFLVPFRFKPWLAGIEHELYLSDEELRVEQRMLPHYVTQHAGMASFEKLLGVYAALAAPFAARGGPAAWFSRETFRPVPADFDHTRSPHALEALNYPFEDYQGRPIRWDRAIRPMAERLR
jgi:LmbE family N-acetylglucosaminyl deacetylase